MKKLGETYLGDGLYASYDGHQIMLRAPRLGDEHVVYLDTSVMLAFLAFVEHIKSKSAD